MTNLLPRNTVGKSLHLNWGRNNFKPLEPSTFVLIEIYGEVAVVALWTCFWDTVGVPGSSLHVYVVHPGCLWYTGYVYVGYRSSVRSGS
jgi:hypothetical protein